MSPTDVATATLAVRFAMSRAEQENRPELVHGLGLALRLCEDRLLTAARQADAPAPAPAAQAPVAPPQGMAGPIMSHHSETLRGRADGEEPIPPTPFAPQRVKAVGSCPDCGGQLSHLPNCGKPKPAATLNPPVSTPTEFTLPPITEPAALPAAAYCCKHPVGHPGPHEYSR